MGVSYDKLWKLMEERNIKRTEIRKATGISPSTFSKMNRNEYVAVGVLVKLCCVLDCSIRDVVDVVED